ncbi:hypothetical protein L5515_015940 [Caenorhabditis briggsae]|uniref:Uncharacterized protein n=1 Tax=Caenorhabditis briggsae TaxID=6238 RepID=A0AAE9J9X1_CAEBR|nr:hypothetical protein L5515_015940 [Caenorhabditis briggsae]
MILAIQADSNSTRTAIPKTETIKSEGSRSLKTARSGGNSTGLKDVVDILWSALMFMLMIIVRALHSAFEFLSDAFVKIYRILLFCYRKPHHAKELIVSTIHIIKVSYDAEIWTWTDMWQIFKSHLIAPMTRAPPPPTSQKSVKTK